MAAFALSATNTKPRQLSRRIDFSANRICWAAHPTIREALIARIYYNVNRLAAIGYGNRFIAILFL
jgi:hypothetical protein